jgi:hypothetical protein
MRKLLAIAFLALALSAKAATQTFTMTRGDTASLSVPCSQSITSASVVIWTAKKNIGDLDTAAIIQKTLGAGITLSGDGLTAYVALVPADSVNLNPETLYWDIQAQFSDGSVHTVASGTLIFTADVTRGYNTSIPIYTTNPPAIAGSSWGGITGTLANQTDLAAALAAKSPVFTNSAGLSALLSDETGTGAAVFATSPTLVTPALGTPSALVLTNATGLPNGGLLNSSITIAGNATALGGSVTADQITGLSTTGLVKRTAANTYAIATLGTDYTAPSDTETLTNKTISGSSNTLSGIGNGSLTNSSITIAGTATSLGGSITLDTIDNGLSTTGLIKRTGANTRAIATAGTDYQAAITFGTGELAALGYAINSANGLVGYSGALGTPTSGTLTNCTFPTLNQNTTGSAGSVANALTLNNSNSGASSGATFNGSAAVTLSANTLGAGSLANTNTWTQTNTFNVPPTINSAENNEGVFAKVVSTNGFLGVVNGSDLGPTAYLEDNGGIGLVQILTNANTDNSGINIESGVTGGAVYTVTFKASASVTETFPSTSFTAARTDAAQTFTGKQTFSPTSTLSGLNVGSYAGNPSSPANGDLWYNSTGNVLNAQINGSTVSLGSGGGGAVTSVTSSTNLVTASPTTGAVVITMPAPDVQSGTSYTIPAADVELIFTGSSAASYAMPSSPASNAVLYVKNAGTAALTLTSSANFFTYTGGFGSLVLEPGDAAYLPYGNSTWIVQ